MGSYSRFGNDLYEGHVSIDFVGRKWLWYAISGVIRAGRCRRADRFKGLNLGIEFEGGVEYQGQPAQPQVTQTNVDEIRTAVAGTGIPEAQVADRQHLRQRGDPGADRGDVQRRHRHGRRGDRETRWASTPTNDISTQEVGASWGSQVARPGDHRPGGVPGPGGAVHLGVLPRVEDVGRCDRRAGPRPGDHRRGLRPVRVRGHVRRPSPACSPSSASPSTTPSWSSTRCGRTPRTCGRAARRTPSWPTSRSTRPWSARSTPRSWRCSRSARCSTSASSSWAPAR